MCARYSGSKAVVYMSTSGTGAATSTVALNSWSLDMSVDTIEVTAFGDTNKQYVVSLPDVSGSLSGWWDDTSDGLYDAMKSSDGVKMYLYPASTAATKYFYGPAWVSFAIEVGNSDGISISGDFSANGAWSMM